jgi:hypothetical protein
MKPEQQAALRAPFPKSAIGKLPKGGAMLDFVGHAAVTDRLLAVDPEWTWAPLALDPTGLPLYDPKGGLWITLTIGGTTRLGYGDGPDPKQRIGDAIRNAAMRFGVALDLWSRDDISATTHIERTSAPLEADPWANHSPASPDVPSHNPIPAGYRGPFLTEEGAPKRMWALLRELFGTDKDKSAEFMHAIVTREWASSKELTYAEVMEIITAAQGHLAAVKP